MNVLVEKVSKYMHYEYLNALKYPVHKLIVQVPRTARPYLFSDGQNMYNRVWSVPGDLVHEGLLRKNGADQPRLNSVVQLGGPLPRVENGNKY